MQNLRILRRRIRSVQNTQKITQAMQMVAGAKLRRVQGELIDFRPYAERLKGITERFLKAHPGLKHPLLGEGVTLSFPPSVVAEGRLQRESRGESDPRFREDENDIRGMKAPTGLVVLSSDTGLCGTYNERLLSAAERFLRENPSTQVIAIGKKGSRALARRGIGRVKEILDWGGRYESSRVNSLFQWLKELYLDGTVSSWWIAYTQFLSALRFKPVVERLLPAERPPLEEAGRIPERQIVEPNLEEAAEQLVARFLGAEFRRILLEAFTSEHSARMIAMKNATDNASEMIRHLTLVRNKVRQAAITKELIEVVSGAEALK
ncbi:MAG: F0F1 ATP synthase subunit gamma [Candidatus Omnitrophica bacterium]|nr:F0F1 ATP synthase subunit gamma [Candidatus Omnitrophota bacterium]